MKVLGRVKYSPIFTKENNMCVIDDPFDYQVLNLTKQFYADYPNPLYKEIVFGQEGQIRDWTILK